MKKRLNETRISSNVIRKRKRSLMAWLMVLVMSVAVLPIETLAQDYEIQHSATGAEYDLTNWVGKVLKPGDTISWTTRNKDTTSLSGRPTSFDTNSKFLSRRN